MNFELTDGEIAILLVHVGFGVLVGTLVCLWGRKWLKWPSRATGRDSGKDKKL